MKIIQANFHGDTNVGLFAKASDKFCIIGNFVMDKSKQGIEKTLGVKVFRVTIANTDLVGIFCVMNSNGILLPKIVNSREMEIFRKLKKQFGINLAILPSKFTAIGNLVSANDNGAIMSKTFSHVNKKKIEDCLGVEAEYVSVASQNIVGSLSVTTNKGCLLHRDAEESEMKKIEEILKVKVDIGTANFGSPFVASCVVANSNGAAVGEQTTGPEVVRIAETLDLM
ncbi:MAG TPA: translation initiation factor IF-6 [archaeon]|nr:translation initiation factor IF-6 [archaeon]